MPNALQRVANQILIATRGATITNKILRGHGLKNIELV